MEVPVDQLEAQIGEFGRRVDPDRVLSDTQDSLVRERPSNVRAGSVDQRRRSSSVDHSGEIFNMVVHARHGPDHQIDLIRRVNYLEKTHGQKNGQLEWVINRDQIIPPHQRFLFSSPPFKFRKGLADWKFMLQLIPRGEGAGHGRFVSLRVLLQITGFEMASVCPSKITITLKNHSDKIHFRLILPEEPQDFQAIVEPGEISKGRPMKKIETFFPYEVFEPERRYIVEGKLLVKAQVE